MDVKSMSLKPRDFLVEKNESVLDVIIAVILVAAFIVPLFPQENIVPLPAEKEFRIK